MVRNEPQRAGFDLLSFLKFKNSICSGVIKFRSIFTQRTPSLESHSSSPPFGGVGGGSFPGFLRPALRLTGKSIGLHEKARTKPKYLLWVFRNNS